MESKSLTVSSSNLLSGLGARPGTQLARQTTKAMEQVAARTAVAEAMEQGRAVLADAALQNAGALSALEAHLIQVAPLGEARYKHIVDAYAMGAARAIARW